MRQGLLIVLCWLSLCGLAAESNAFRFRHYSIADGLPSNTVRALAQDADGFIWLGTDEGLCRFDGIAFVPFVFHEGSPSPAVMALLADSDRLLVGTDEGLYAYDPLSESLSPLSLPDELSSSVITSLVIDGQGTLWLSTFARETCRFDTTANAFVLAPLPEGEGLVFLGNRLTYTEMEIPDTFSHVHCTYAYSPQEMLIGTDDGLYVYNVLTGSTRLYNEDETDPHAISNRFVHAILRDYEGGLWIGTYYGGVNYVSPFANQFEAYAHSSYRNSVGGNVVGRFCEDTSGRIWIASDDGGVSCFDRASHDFTNFTTANSGLPYNNVHALCQREGDLWIGTYAGGISAMDLTTHHFRNYPFLPYDADGNMGESCYSLFATSDGTLWAGTMKGVDVYDPAADTFRFVYSFNALCIDIDQDRDGMLWFATQGGGLYRYSPHTHHWKRYDLANGQINCCHIDAEGQLWVGTMDGFYTYEREADIFCHIEASLPSRNVMGIVGGRDTLWLTTSQGLFQLSPSDTNRAPQSYGQREGLQNGQFLPNAILRASDGYIYVGTVSGFNAFRPSDIHSNTVPPRLAFTRLEVFNKEVPVGTERLPVALNHLKRLELPYRDNVFSLSVASLSYCIPQNNHYAYKLEGFDRDWNYVGGQHRETYTNLPPGAYTLRVIATNSDGLWTRDGLSLPIVIHPPFFLSLPAKLFYALLAVLLLYATIRYIMRRMDRRHTAEIERLNAEREQQAYATRMRYINRITDIASNPTDNAFLARLYEVIEQNFANPDLSIAFLAKELCLSRSGLFSKVKSLTDVTPNEMIQLVRLKRAAQLLDEGDFRINEVCYKVGFSSPSYFAKCFAKQYGINPGEYAACHAAPPRAKAKAEQEGTPESDLPPGSVGPEGIEGHA